MAIRFLFTKLGVIDLSNQAHSLIKKFLIYSILITTLFMLSNTFYILFFIDAIGYGEVGILLAIGFLTQAVFDYPTGVLSDWIGQKWVLFVAFIGFSLSYGLLCFASTFMELLVVYLIQSLSSAQFSGAMDTWFDNNYKITADDPNREVYGLFKGKSNAIFDITGSTMIILGGLLATVFFRETVFMIQAVGMLFLAFLILFTMKDYNDIERSEKSFNVYLQKFQEGLSAVASDYRVLFLVLGVTIYQSTLVIFGNFVMLPIYFGYTGSDFGASLFRYSLWITGTVCMWVIVDKIKEWNPFKWVPRVHFVHTFYFYFVLAFILFIFPLNNEFLLIGIILSGLTIQLGHFMRMMMFILLQRVYLDLIPDSRRNSFIP